MDKYVVKEIRQKHNGREYVFSIGVKAKNIETDAEHRFASDAEKKAIDDALTDIMEELKKKPNNTDSLNNNTVSFTSATTRANIKSRESLAIIFGKIHKYFADLKAPAFSEITNSISSGTDADIITKKALKEVNNKFGECQFEVKSDGAYVTYKRGADTVSKKLGNAIELIDSFDKDLAAASNYIIDLTSRTDYKNLTKNNFIIEITNIEVVAYSTHGYTGNADCSGISTIEYNQQTGQLMVGLPVFHKASGNLDDEHGAHMAASCKRITGNVYLVER